MTGTSRRSDEIGLGYVYQEVAYTKTLREMIEDEYLVPLRGYLLRGGADLEQVRTRTEDGERDFDPHALARAINTPKRNQLVVDGTRYAALAEGRPTLVFAADIAHSDALAALFRQRRRPRRQHPRRDGSRCAAQDPGDVQARPARGACQLPIACSRASISPMILPAARAGCIGGRNRIVAPMTAVRRAQVRVAPTVSSTRPGQVHNAVVAHQTSTLDRASPRTRMLVRTRGRTGNSLRRERFRGRRRVLHPVAAARLPRYPHGRVAIPGLRAEETCNRAATMHCCSSVSQGRAILTDSNSTGTYDTCMSRLIKRSTTCIPSLYVPK